MQHNPVNEGVLLLVGPGSRYIVADYGLRSLRAGGELMPADRRIVVNVSAEGHRDERGDYVPGEVTPIAAWATRRDVGQERKVERGGAREETSRDWRIRWDRRIALSPTLLLEVEDELELFTITNMVEVTQQRGGPDIRRRFLDLQGVRS